MALKVTHKESSFGVGDVVRVHQRVMEATKHTDEQKGRIQVFEGIVIRIKGREEGKTFTVRRIGAQKIGIEQIYPLHSPLVEKVEVVRNGLEGVRQSKLYFVRNKSKREIETIYSRAAQKNQKPVVKKAAKKEAVKKVKKTK